MSTKKANTYPNHYTKTEKILLVGSPLILGILEIWHPVGSPNKTAFEAILPQVDWWLTLHLLQLPLFGLMALAVLLLVRELQGFAAKISRIGIAFFLVFYTALDSVTGIASGILIRSVEHSSPNTQAFVAKQVNLLFFDPIVGGSTFSAIGVLGAGGWLIGVTAAAIALARVGVSRFAVGLLIFAAVFFGISHTPPLGSLGLACFFVATTIISLSTDNIAILNRQR